MNITCTKSSFLAFPSSESLRKILKLCFFPFLPLLVHSEYLDIWDVDMMRGRDQSNKIEHHTNLYQSDNLIVRRGQEFTVKITFNRPYKPNQDKFAVEFVIGKIFPDRSLSVGLISPRFS